MQWPQPIGPYTRYGAPISTPVTPGPRASTHPDVSWPNTNGGGIKPVTSDSNSSNNATSEWHAPAPATLSSTSPGPGVGTSISSSVGNVFQLTEHDSTHGSLLLSTRRAGP